MRDAPELGVGLVFFYEAWETLDSCRTERGRIPWTAVLSYANEYGIVDTETRDDLFYLVEQLDRAYIRYENEQRRRGNT